MKKILAALTLSLLCVEAQAISRYTSTAMSCGEVQSRVDEEGAAILRHRSTRNPSLLLYNRYVRDRQFCSADEEIEFAYVPTADRQSCPVYKCELHDESDWRILRRN